MARFIGYVQGQSGEASRIGSPNSGIHAQAQGWSVGVRVFGGPVDDDPSVDEFEIYMTGGSNGATPSVHIGCVTLDEYGKPVFKPSSVS